MKIRVTTKMGSGKGMSILRRLQHEGKHKNMHSSLQRIGEKEKMLLVVKLALPLDRRTKFRGLQ